MESLTNIARTSPAPVTRRDVLRLAAGLGLSFLMPPLTGRAADERGSKRAPSLITIWLAGGASQLETWDPHPGSKTGGPTRAIPTAIRGVRVAEHFPRVAEVLDRFTVIRSLVSKEGDHERGTYYLKTGYRPDPTLTHPSLGAIAAHELPDSDVEIPQHVSLGPGQWPARGGFLGDEFDAFRIFEPGQNLRNLRPRVGDKRQADRVRNLDAVNSAFRVGRRFPSQRTLHEETTAAALRMMDSQQLRAFELDGESDAVKLAYGETNFGRGCLVARRLIETGVRSVEVSLTGFDTHANNFEGHRTQAEILDPALAMLTRELVERDLFASTTVLVASEFGRTPRVNPLDGRDHWPLGFSCLVGGGAFRAGQVIGETNPNAVTETARPTDPVEVGDLYATVLHSLTLDPDKEYATPIGRPMAAASGQVLDRLLRDDRA